MSDATPLYIHSLPNWCSPVLFCLTILRDLLIILWQLSAHLIDLWDIKNKWQCQTNLVVILEPTGCQMNKLSWLVPWGPIIHQFCQHCFWPAARWHWGYTLDQLPQDPVSMILVNTNRMSLTCLKSYRMMGKKAASSDRSNIHNNGEQHQENKIKEPRSSAMYSIWSIWDCSSESFYSTFSFKALWWTKSSVPWIFFSFYKVFFQNLPSIKTSEYVDHGNVGGREKDKTRLFLVFLSPIIEYSFLHSFKWYFHSLP